LDTLLKSARNYLDITWEDAEGDAKLLEIIKRGMKYIDGIAGSEMDYMEPGAAQGLLLNYCIYERSSTLNDFQPNYLHDLLSLQLVEAAKRRKRSHRPGRPDVEQDSDLDPDIYDPDLSPELEPET